MNLNLNQSLSQILKNQEEIIKLVSTTNTSISQLAADFNKFAGDANTYFTDQTAFNAQLKAFLASLSSGSGGTTLSPADQATVNSLDQAIAPLDTQANTLNAALSGLTLPGSAPSGTAPAGS
jgi:hypothetical protein